MKIIRFLLFCVSLIPLSVNAAPSEFSMAAQLLAAAKNADVQQVQALVNNGANVNFVDSTGLSIVCTALMNNDVRAAQILQMYGADASRCDVQIKRYNSKNKPKSTGGLFGGLSSAQSLTLAAAAHLKEGDQLTMEQLIAAMLLPSGNDAAQVAAVAAVQVVQPLF